MISKGFYFPSKIDKNKGDRDFNTITAFIGDSIPYHTCTLKHLQD